MATCREKQRKHDGRLTGCVPQSPRADYLALNESEGSTGWPPTSFRPFAG